MLAHLQYFLRAEVPSTGAFPWYHLAAWWAAREKGGKVTFAL